MGDTWWEIGEKQPPVIREALRFRAKIWYLRARRHLQGLKKQEVESRIKFAPTRFAFVHVRAEIDGMDEIRLFDERANWNHRENQFPANVTVNGVAWNVRDKDLPNSGTTRFMPSGIDFTTGKVVFKKGRVKLTSKANPDVFYVHMLDRPTGAGATEFLIQFGAAERR